MDLQLNGKTALVTSLTAGIGVAIACFLAAKGADVIATGRDQAKLEAAVAEIGTGCGSVIASLVAYIASPLSAATNNAALRVDGCITPTIVWLARAKRRVLARAPGQ